jgi:hypothetical protein
VSDRTGLAAELVSRRNALVAEAERLTEAAAELISAENAASPEPASA